MSFYCDGSASSKFLSRSTGLISSTGTFTVLFALKIHTLKASTVVPYELASYSGSATAHLLVTDSDGRTIRLYSNYLDSPTTSAVATLTVGSWYWIAIRGNGTSLSLSITAAEGSSWTTVSTTQTAFTPTVEYLGSSDSVDDESAKVAVSHVRQWNAVLSDANLLTEIATSSAAYGTNLVTANDGSGADLAAALVSETGTTFLTPNGGITYNVDQPSFGAPPPESETITVSGEVSVSPQIEITNATALANVISFNGNYVSADNPSGVTVSYQLYKEASPYSASSEEFNSLSGTFTGILSDLPASTYTVSVTIEDSYGTSTATSDPLVVESGGLTITPYTEDEFVGPLSGWTILTAPNDGVADATSAIQAALSALVSTASNSTVLYVPSGTYRITSTLVLASGLGITLVGEDPETTTFVWNGDADGTLLYLYGSAYSRVARITFDGNGDTQSLIHNFKETSSTNYTPVLNDFRDCVFKNSKYGLRNGNAPLQAGGSSASQITRCLFQNNTLAGIAQQDSSTLNWFIWDCAFLNNAHGITNYYGAPEATGSGAGNFSVFRCVFKNNSVADMSIGNVSVFSARECDSEGSDVFFKSLVTLSATANVGLYSNIVRTVGVPVQFGVPAGVTGCPGSLVLIDNQLKKSTAGSPVVLYSNATYTDVVSVGNIYSSNPTISSSSTGARILALDDVVSGGIGASTKSFVGFAPKVSRTVYEVAAPSSSAIQSAINSASALSNKAYVHLARGQWDINAKIVIPENSDITLLGDGGLASNSIKGTTLRWVGSAGSTMLEVHGPTRARVRDLGLDGNSTASLGIHVINVDQSGGRILFDQLRVSDQLTGNSGCFYVDPLEFTRVNVRGLFHYQSVNYPAVTVKGSDVRIWGGVAQMAHSMYSVQNNGKLVAASVQYDQASTRALWFENGSGDTTILDHLVAPYLKDGLKVANQTGITTFLSSYFTSTASPNNELQFTLNGTSTTKVGFIGNKVMTNASPLIVTTGSPEVTLAENVTALPSAVHSKYPDTTVDTSNRVRAHLSQIRSVSLPVPQSTVLNNTDLRFDRVGVKKMTATGVFVQSGGLGGGGSTSGGSASPPAGVMQWIVQTTDAPVDVPANFVGMHFNSRPLGVNVAPEPMFGYGTVRSHDWDPAGSGGPQWLQIEPVQGVYNTSEINAWANFYQGRRRIWTWGATPLWAASSTNTSSTWGPPGSNTPPSNPAFVNGTIQRVLDTTGVEVIEIWNEPEPHIDYPGWFYGNPTQLANMTLAAVNAVGSRNVTILGPAYTDFDGTTGAEWKIQQLRAALPGPTYDGFSWHWYDYEGNVNTTATRLHNAIASVRGMVTTHFGSTMPLWLTEIGAFNWSASDSWSDQDHANAVARWLLVSAAHRQQTCCLYMYESWYAGYPQGTPVVQSVIANAHANVAGKTIQQAAILVDGSVWAEFSDGSQVLDGVQTVAPDTGTPTASTKQFVFFQLF